MKHTPGPWKIMGDEYGKGVYILADTDSTLIGIAYEHANPIAFVGREDRQVANANARLIAASPETHAELKALVDFLDAWNDPDSIRDRETDDELMVEYNVEYDARLNKARLAIAKAEATP